MFVEETDEGSRFGRRIRSLASELSSHTVTLSYFKLLWIRGSGSSRPTPPLMCPPPQADFPVSSLLLQTASEWDSPLTTACPQLSPSCFCLELLSLSLLQSLSFSLS